MKKMWVSAIFNLIRILFEHLFEFVGKVSEQWNKLIYKGVRT